MDRTSYFLCRFRLGDAEAYLIWYSNGSDGILAEANGAVPCFSTPAELMRFAQAHGVAIEQEEPALHDLDAITTWLSRNDRNVDCNQFLRAWNLFTDLSASVKGEFDVDHARTNTAYEKLFQCAAESGMEDDWSDEELQILRDTMTSGLELFRRHIRMQQAAMG